MAEELFRKMTGGKYPVQSAGTLSNNPGNTLGSLMPLTSHVLEVMNEEGIDVSNNVRKQVTEEMVKEADKVILVVDERDPIPDYINLNTAIKWDVIDPKGQTLEFTRDTKEQIKAHIKDLITQFVL
jgi:protein-tyrosine-phosphatase